MAGDQAQAGGAGQPWAKAERPPPTTGAGAAAPRGSENTWLAGPLRTSAAPSRPRAQPRPSLDPGPPAPAYPAPVGSGAPRAQPGQLVGGRPRPLRAHSRRRAAGPGPLGTILPAAPGAASGSAGPRREPEASPAHATATQTPVGVRQPWFPGRKNATANAAVTSDTWRPTAARPGQDSSVANGSDHAPWLGHVVGAGV